MNPIPRKFSGFTEKIILWIIASTLTVVLALVGTMYAKVSNDAEIAKNLATKHDAELPYLKQSNDRIESKLDRLTQAINELMLKKFGYVPPAPLN